MDLLRGGPDPFAYICTYSSYGSDSNGPDSSSSNWSGPGSSSSNWSGPDSSSSDSSRTKSVDKLSDDTDVDKGSPDNKSSEGFSALRKYFGLDNNKPIVDEGSSSDTESVDMMEIYISNKVINGLVKFLDDNNIKYVQENGTVAHYNNMDICGCFTNNVYMESSIVESIELKKNRFIIISDIYDTSELSKHAVYKFIDVDFIRVRTGEMETNMHFNIFIDVDKSDMIDFIVDSIRCRLQEIHGEVYRSTQINTCTIKMNTMYKPDEIPMYD